MKVTAQKSGDWREFFLEAWSGQQHPLGQETGHSSGASDAVLVQGQSGAAVARCQPSGCSLPLSWLVCSAQCPAFPAMLWTNNVLSGQFLLLKQVALFSEVAA